MIVAAEDITALVPYWPNNQSRAFVGCTYLEIASASASVADRRLLLTRLAARTPEGRNVLLLWAAGCAQDVRDLITDEDARDAADVCIATVAAYVAGCATARDCADAAAASYYAYYPYWSAYGASSAPSYHAAYAASSASSATAYAYYSYYVPASEQQLVNLATALTEAAVCPV